MRFLLPKKSRELTYVNINKNKSPKEFFYGCLTYPGFKIDEHIIDTRPSAKEFSTGYIKRGVNKLFNLNFSKSKAYYIFKQIPKDSKIICFTDWDSMNMALNKNIRKDVKIICGFHGLYNFYKRTKDSFFLNKKKFFINGLKNIDHIFFFGLEDQKKSIEFFEIKKEKTSHFNFGVDTSFWKKKKTNQSIDVLSIGSDLNRNYKIFKYININYNLTLITKLNVSYLKNKANIVYGSKNTYNLSDLDIRRYYNEAKIVVIPLKETLQPSGNSVTLQAMACGKPVILTKIKGLWDKDLLKDFRNIVLVSPNNPNELEEKINLLLKNKKLRDEIGSNAEATARKYLSLDRMNRDFKNLLNLKY